MTCNFIPALKLGDVRLVHTLVDHGWDIHLKNKSKKSCHDIVKSMPNDETKLAFTAALHRKPPLKRPLVTAGTVSPAPKRAVSILHSIT